MRSLVPLAFILSVLGAMHSATASGATGQLAAADVRWACEQPAVARLRITGVGVQAPDVPCTRSGAPGAGIGCRIPVVDAIVLESLPTVGARPGLSTSDYPHGAARFSFRLATRDYSPVKSPPVSLLGDEALIGLQDISSTKSGQPATFPLGVLIPLIGPPADSLETLCKPYRHWSGQTSPELPERLPGADPLALDRENELAKALATLIADQPPEPLAIEERFGVRMLAAFPLKEGRSDFRTLVRLPQRWVRIERQSWPRPNGRASVRIEVEITKPFNYPSDRPWWYGGSRANMPEMGHCISPWMLFNQLGPNWLPPPTDPYFKFTERAPEARYDVTVFFHGMETSSPHAPPAALYSPYRCIGNLTVDYQERPQP